MSTRPHFTTAVISTVISCLPFNSRESDDEIGYCNFCCRQLYIPDTKFCDRACENRKRQLSWKSANIGNHKPLHPATIHDRRPAITVITEKHPIAWRYGYEESPRSKRNRYVWGTARRPDQFTNFTDYKPSWAMYGQ